MTIEIDTEGRRYQLQVQRGGPGWTVALDGRSVAASVAEAGDRWSVLIGHRSYEVAFEPRAAGDLIVHVNGTAIALSIVGSRRRSRRSPAGAHGVGSAIGRRGDHATGSAHGGMAAVTAPMPGRVVKVLVAPGEEVTARQGVIVIEAMKMENELRSPRAGRVTEVRAAEGASVEAGAVLVVLE